MKRISALLLTFAILLTLCSCGDVTETASGTESTSKETTVTTDAMTKQETETTATSEVLTEINTYYETETSTQEATTTTESIESTASDTETEFSTDKVAESSSATESERITETETDTDALTETETETEAESTLVLDAAIKGDRPVLFETDEMLALSKQKADLLIEPFYSSWQNVRKMADLALDTDPAPYLEESATQYRFAACSDFIRARSLALAYYHTGEQKYLDRAVEYLMAYSTPKIRPGTDKHLDYSAPTTDGEADIGLNLALPLTTACDAYSLLYPYMNDTDKESFESWIKAEVKLIKKGHNFWIEHNYYGAQLGNNHLTSHLMGLICAAYVLEDTELLEYAVNSVDNESNYLVMFDRAILMSGDELYSADPSDVFSDGEIYDRYRVVSTPSNGFGYAMYHLKFLTYSAFVMYNNGVNFFEHVGSNGETLLLPFRYYADYLIENDSTLKGGYYSGNALNLESSYTIYLIANYVYQDEVVANVVKTLAENGVAAGDSEIFGRSGGYILGQD